MLSRLSVAMLLACAVMAGASDAQVARSPSTRIDWPAFLGRHDLVWKRPPARWGESAFIGNGRIGATIDLQDGLLGWTINRTDFVHGQSRFPMGRVVANTAGAVTGGNARLVLWDAEAS